jgi:hypothetical protein
MSLRGPLPPNISRLMAKETRKQIGPNAETPEESSAKEATKTEREEQSTFADLLRQRKERGELIYDWSATHKKTTNITGRADFWVAANNKFLQLEFKAPGGRLSPEQKQMKSNSQAAGVDYHIVRSAADAYLLLVQWLETI